jgi:hypothetical protein
MNVLYDANGKRIADPAVSYNGTTYSADSKLPGIPDIGQSALGTATNNPAIKSSFVHNPATSVEASNTAAGLSNAHNRAKKTKAQKRDENAIKSAMAM